ncbi:ABC transporter substrate-binding protein [Raoultibacter phocaeensis]|uniref:ABC transporter substrate-binding protein n=1 Tax=Raoultibacter phocaeensis TaxID=2479841 RepID=UPI0015D61D36|nr:ABC transporter substrate-binding protein [Raoultibacter phocaeensis]
MNEQDRQTIENLERPARFLSRRSFIGLSGCVVFTALAGGGLLAGCSSEQAKEEPATSESAAEPTEQKPAGDRTVKNLDGSEIVVPAEVTSVAAIFGPSYEKLVAVGAEGRITCDGDFHISGWPWSNVIYKRVNDVPGIPNAHSDLNVEDLVAQGVQVVFCFPNPAQAEAINNAGMVAVPMTSTGAFKDVADTLTLYADVMGDEKAASQAKAYAKYFDEKVAMVKERTANVTERPSVYLAYTDMLHGYGAKSDMVEVIELAGGELASKTLEGSSNIEVTAEQLLEWNPDYIFLDHAGSSGNATAEDAINEALATGDFNSIAAVAENQVVATPTGVFFWDSGIQKILYLVYIAKTIHPDLFEDVDMKELLVDFYQQFFDYSLTDEEAERILNHQDPA